ncbi:MAG: hypothetical protein JXR96_27515 [Deltaproteobacteria bacterium]|nr:hypothetical protein [Deltaproteobacteria bacterium]
MSSRPTQSRFRREHLLMPNRVREVLLVSSAYDAFVLEEEGHLTEQIFLEYKSLSLSSAPRFSHVTRRDEAIELLEEHKRFDLVLAVAREASEGLVEFGRRIKAVQPRLPVVVLGFESADLERLKKPETQDGIDAVFVWNGDAKILLAIIKHIEDRQNVDHDIDVAGVRVILVVEDSLRYFSSFLAALYPELMKQSQSLFSEGFNRLQKLLRMRTRPKILHATSFEQAIEIYESYRGYMLAVISDVGFPRNGKLDPTAGIRLVERIRADFPDLPILLQSAESDYSEQANRLSALFADKNAPDLLHTIRSFLVDYLGFGPFTFRTPDGRVVGQARDIRELAAQIETVPAESLAYHTRNNHISNWLMARSEYELSENLRCQDAADFASVEEIRSFLLRVLEALFRHSSQGIVTDFSSTRFDNESLFQRIGEGSLGGKARGIAFLNNLLTYELGGSKVAGLQVCIPQTFVLSTDAFERFLGENQLHSFVRENPDDAALLERFVSGRLPDDVRVSLLSIIDNVHEPLAVRSSSLLEDDMAHPFAGIYGTVMIPNAAEDPKERLDDLCKAIKVVYASVFFRNARSYLENTAHSIEEELMAIVLQRVVGQRFEDRYYPHLSGVAHSYNYYPIGPLRADEGVVQAVLGLGRMVVEGGESVRFSPRHPEVIPQAATPKMLASSSQRAFYALDMCRDWYESGFFDDNLLLFDLEVARRDGTFQAVGSVYDVQNDQISESPAASGPLLVTFNNILKYKAVPLAPAICELLDVIADGMGTPVEIEFACDMGDWGRPKRRGHKRREPVLYLLQVRPILVRETWQEVSCDEIPPERMICRSSQALGHGCHEIQDVIFVKPERFDPAETRAIAAEVDELNAILVQDKRPYVLIGPGRWGSSDHWLGIPVQWSQISGARIIIEASPEGYDVDPSQGTHFFHNLTSLNLGYFTVPSGASKQSPRNDSFVDWDWLARQPVVRETEHLRLVRSAQPILAMIDGRHSTAVIAAGLDSTSKS